MPHHLTDIARASVPRRALALVLVVAMAVPTWAQDDPSVESLVDQVASAEPAARVEAVGRLGASYPDGAAATSVLVELLDDEDGAVRDAARGAIVRLAARGLADLATYLEQLPKKPVDREAWIALCRDLTRLGPAATPRDLASALVVRPGAKTTVKDEARMRAVPVLCAAGAVLYSDEFGSQIRAIASSAVRSKDRRLRRNGLAALAVLGRAELVRRRYRGEPLEIPEADDAAAVERIVALLAPDAKLPDDLRASLAERAVLVLGWAYGHGAEPFMKVLAMRGADIGATVAKNRLEVSALAADARGADEYLARFRAPMATVLTKAAAAISVRRAEAVELLPEIRKLLASDERSVRLVAGVLVLHLSPGDPEAGPLVLDELRAVVLDPPGGEDDHERTALIEFTCDWIRRMPDAPAGLAEELFLRMPHLDPEAAPHFARALAPTLARNAMLQRYLIKHFFPAEGEADGEVAGPRTLDALAESLSYAGAASKSLIARWIGELPEDPAADPAEQILQLGPVYDVVRAAYALRLLAPNGPRAASALPAIRPFLTSPDLLDRYLAGVAVRRIESD